MREFLQGLRLLGKKLKAGGAEPAQDIWPAPHQSYRLDTEGGRLIIAEKAVNAWLRQEFLRHRFIRYLSVEFEDGNMINIQVISRYYMQMLIEAELSDAWHDHSTSTLQLKWKTVRFLRMPLLPDFITEKLTYYLLNIIGFLLNPVAVRPGIELRGDGGSLRVDFSRYWSNCRRREVHALFHDASGEPRASDFCVIAAGTDKGFITLHLHPLSQEAQTTVHSAYRPRTPERYQRAIYRLQWADALFLSGIALGVSAIVILLRDYFAIDNITFSFSRYFFLSLVIIGISLVLVNIPRWLYQFLTGKAVNKLQSASENIMYRMERYKRDIELEMRDLIRHYGKIGNQTDPEGRREIERLLLKAGRQRFLAWRMERTMESLNRWRKLKYGLAYAVTIVSEYIAFRWL
ncbi:MAG: hypothetical protein E6X17_14665 [Sporomusaceae bacterium]|nr:hypothetical protein [Sporomusaceae bacterium]